MDPTKLPTLPDQQARSIEIWSKTEDVAMHFNELIMNYRLKAVGGVGVAAGLVGSVLLTKDAGAPTGESWEVFGGAMAFLAAVWLALMVIDISYYQRLLLGAVDEARRIEDESGGVLQLSKKIEAKATRRRYAVSGWVFYLLPLLAIVLVCIFAFRRSL